MRIEKKTNRLLAYSQKHVKSGRGLPTQIDLKSTSGERPGHLFYVKMMAKAPGELNRQLRTVLRTVSGSTASPLRGSWLSAAGVAGWRMRPHLDGDYKHN